MYEFKRGGKLFHKIDHALFRKSRGDERTEEMVDNMITEVCGGHLATISEIYGSDAVSLAYEILKSFGTYPGNDKGVGNDLLAKAKRGELHFNAQRKSFVFTDSEDNTRVLKDETDLTLLIVYSAFALHEHFLNAFKLSPEFMSIDRMKTRFAIMQVHLDKATLFVAKHI